MVSVEVTSGRGRKEMQEKAVQRFGEEESRLGAKTGRSLWVEIGVFEEQGEMVSPEHGECGRERRTRQGLGGIRTLDFRLVFRGRHWRVGTSLVAQMVKKLPAMQETWV